MKHFAYIAITAILLFGVFISGCVEERLKAPSSIQRDVMAKINDENIYLNEVDSIAAIQIYELRMNALNLLISKRILEYEAKRSGMSLNSFIETHINNNSKEVTDSDFENYIAKNEITKIDTTAILDYLTILNQKKSQDEYVDSLKQHYDIKIKLQPPFYKTIETEEIYAHDLSNNKSNTEVYIISDFKCTACQQTHDELEKIYNKYHKQVSFKFIYFSDYIGKDALACEAAAKQNKFKQMHNIIFDNPNLIHHDSIYSDFAAEIGLDMKKFNEDIKDLNLLKNLMNNKEYLIDNEIYSTPTFIVGNKILDKKYAIDYLEDVIVEELNSN